MTHDPLDFLKENERTAVFIDGANLIHAVSKLQFRIDFKKLLELFKYNSDLMRIYYYTALIEDLDDPVHKFVNFLDYGGYTIVTKPVKEFIRDGVIYRKGNMDVDLTIDMLRMAENVDHIVLMSGDGDFKRLVQEVQRDCRVTVISTPSSTADELRRQCDQYISLGDLRKLIALPAFEPREAVS